MVSDATGADAMPDEATVGDQAASPDGDIQRHPIRGALWGIPMGIGISLFLVGQKAISLGTWAPFLAFLLGPVIGVVWAMFAPPKKPKEPKEQTDAEQPEAPGAPVTDA